jgi:AraC family transcriptional regulator
MEHPNPDRVVFSSALVAIGAFRCPTTHPQFTNSGPTGNHCFVFPRRSVWIQHEGHRPFVADPTTVTMYNPTQRYSRRPLSGDGDRSDWFGVAPTLLREVLTSFDASSADQPERLFRFSRGPCDPETYRMQRLVLQHLRRDTAVDTLLVEETVVTLLARTLANAYAAVRPIRRSAAAHGRLAERTRAFMSAHFATPCSLTAMAHAVGCSEYHLCRVFRDQTGLTLHGYRHQLRLRRALEDVCESSRDLLDLALELGYTSHSHFTAMFHREFGVTPSVLRRRARVAMPAHLLRR